MPESTAGRLLSRSLHVRHVDAGSCNGCEAELMAIAGPLYDCQRWGIDFVASPRHADILTVAGPVTRQMVVALQRTYAAMGTPRWVVALGDCAAGGRVFRDCYATAGGIAGEVPVATAIPGCPPSPEVILHHLRSLMSRA